MPPDLPIPTTVGGWSTLAIAVGIIVWVVYALLRGNLVSRRVVEERAADWQARIDQANENSSFWKEAAQEYQKANAEMIPMLDRLLDNHETLRVALEALREGARKHGD